MKYTKHTYIHTRGGAAYLEYCRARIKLSLVRKAVREFKISIANEAKSNRKAFYAYARSKIKAKSGIYDLENRNNIARSNEDEAATLNNFFCNVFTKENLEKVTSI